MRSVDNIPGGKGINVSKILRQYDYEVTATGFLGGYQGRWMEDQLDRLKIRSAFVQVDGETRTSMNIVADNGYVTEILEPGPHISDTQLKEFVRSLPHWRKKADWSYFPAARRRGFPQIFMPGLSGALPPWENR